MSGDRDFIGDHVSDETGVNSGLDYIFHRVNGVCQEEAKIVPVNGESDDWFGHDVDLSGDNKKISGTPGMMIWAISVGLYMFYSYETMEHGSRYRNSPLQMCRIMIGFDIVWKYPETMLSVGEFLYLLPCSIVSSE